VNSVSRYLSNSEHAAVSSFLQWSTDLA